MFLKKYFGDNYELAIENKLSNDFFKKKIVNISERETKLFY